MSLVEILVAMALLSWVMAAALLTMIKSTAVFDQQVYQFYAEQQSRDALWMLWYAPGQFDFQQWQQALSQTLPQATVKISHSGLRIQLQLTWFNKIQLAERSVYCQIRQSQNLPVMSCQI